MIYKYFFKHHMLVHIDDWVFILKNQCYTISIFIYFSTKIDLIDWKIKFTWRRSNCDFDKFEWRTNRYLLSLSYINTGKRFLALRQVTLIKSIEILAATTYCTYKSAHLGKDTWFFIMAMVCNNHYLSEHCVIYRNST